MSPVLYYGIIALYLVFAGLAFWLSFSCYSDEDETPVGMRALLALLAGLWNIIYIIYYLFGAYVLGLSCS